MINRSKLWIGWKVWGVALAFIFLTNAIGESIQGQTRRKNQRALRSSVRSLRPGSFQTQTTTKWKNQRGSTLVLINDGRGNLTGEFKTAVGCEAGTPRKLFGTINGTAISFTVNFEGCISITAWNGHFDNASNPQKIKTLWLLTIGTPTAPSDFKSTLAGSDEFMRTQ